MSRIASTPLAFAFFLTVSRFTTSQTAFASPVSPFLVDQMRCRSTYFIYGNEDFSNLETFSNIKLLHLKSSFPEFEKLDGNIIVNPLLNKVEIRVSDGDQLTTITFLLDDVRKKTKANSYTLRGTIEDGYDWNDGYHTRALFGINCQ